MDENIKVLILLSLLLNFLQFLSLSKTLVSFPFFYKPSLKSIKNIFETWYIVYPHAAGFK